MDTKAENPYFKEPRLLNLPRHRSAYSDRTAWTFSVLADLAYSPPGAAMIADLKRGGFRFKGDFRARFMDKYDTYGMVVESDDYGVLVFRGTVPTDVANWVTDLDFLPHRMDGGKVVHQGFFAAFEPVRPEILALVRGLRKPFFITGHSLGGALAVMAAYAFTDEFHDQIQACYTYGCPKVGNIPFLETLYRVPIYQVVHRQDLVPHVPPTALSGFHDSGDIRHLLHAMAVPANPEDKGFIVKGVKGWATGAAWFLKLWLNWLVGMALNALRLVPGGRTAARKMLTPLVVIQDHSIERYSACLLKIALEHNPAPAVARPRKRRGPRIR